MGRVLVLDLEDGSRSTVFLDRPDMGRLVEHPEGRDLATLKPGDLVLQKVPLRVRAVQIQEEK